MDKILDLSKTIYELSKEDHRIIDIMAGIGFDRITDPLMINTVGRFMTIPKGAASRGMNLDAIKAAFELEGYKIRT